MQKGRMLCCCAEKLDCDWNVIASETWSSEVIFQLYMLLIHAVIVPEEMWVLLGIFATVSAEFGWLRMRSTMNHPSIYV